MEERMSTKEEELAATLRHQAWRQTFDRLQAKWAAMYGVKPSSGRCAWQRLLGRRVGPLCGREDPMPDGDHQELWNLHGRPIVLVSMPYDLDIYKLVDWTRDHGLVATVELWPAWHNPGKVLFVEITTPEGRRLLNESRAAIFAARKSSSDPLENPRAQGAG
jgi:hypothetical protein